MHKNDMLVRDWHSIKDSLSATNLAFAAAVGRRAPVAEQLALAHEVAWLQDEEHKLGTAVRARRLWPLGDFWATTICNTVPSALG